MQAAALRGVTRFCQLSCFCPFFCGGEVRKGCEEYSWNGRLNLLYVWRMTIGIEEDHISSSFSWQMTKKDGYFKERLPNSPFPPLCITFQKNDNIFHIVPCLCLCLYCTPGLENSPFSSLRYCWEKFPQLPYKDECSPSLFSDNALYISLLLYLKHHFCVCVSAFSYRLSVTWCYKLSLICLCTAHIWYIV